jgi:Ca2+/Na+ antiporter
MSEGFMNWFKTHSYTITKMLLNQFGIMLLGIILVNILTAKMPALRIVASLYTSLFFMYLLYVMTWEQGAKDRIRADAGYMKFDRLCGLKLSLFANIPNFLIALLLLIGFLFGTLVSEQTWAQGMFGVTHAVAICWESMYTGFINAVLDPAVTSSLSVGYVIAYVLAPLPPLFASTLGYIMGSNNKRLLGAFSAKKPQ